MADAELVVIGNDGLDRIRRVALRAIPELLTGFKGDGAAEVMQQARDELHAFFDKNGTQIATSTVAQLRRAIAASFDPKPASVPDVQKDMSDEEVLAAMEAAEAQSAKVAADLAAKVALLVHALDTLAGLARSAVMAGLSALAAAA